MQDPRFLQRLSTRLGFLAAGIAMSVWAALVPFAKLRFGLGPAELGLLLLCLGTGSLVAMPLTGMLESVFGCRPLIVVAGALTCLALPLLCVATNPVSEAAVLIIFGAAVGTLDVAMNIQAVVVEKAQGSALMSGFHGYFSIGGFVGAGGMALLLWVGLTPRQAACALAVFMAAVLLVASPYLLTTSAGSTPQKQYFAIPRGVVILIGLLCFLMFLAEGAVLDWSAVLLTGAGRLATSQGGVGYAMFAVAMTVGRLTGDSLVERWGRARVLQAGGLCTAAGFFVTVLGPVPWATLCGFCLVGAGASNIVPILYTAAGRQTDMPPGIAISAITTLGYTGILAGPALIGFIAQASNLNLPFAVLGCAMLLVVANSRLGYIARSREKSS